MFNEDKQKGEAVEDLFINLLKGKHPGIEITKGVVGEKAFDICVCTKFPILYEVKADFKAQETGNIAIEYRYKKQASGISTTKSHYWVQLLGEKFYVFNTHDLREELKLNWLYYQKVEGGDDNQSQLVLLPILRVNNFHFLNIWQ